MATGDSLTISVSIFLGLVHALIVRLVYHVLPDVYMDEIFHVDQVRRYCVGNYTWNPMITTPPGLYLLSIPFCGYERYVNSVLVPILFLGCVRLTSMYTSRNCILHSLVVISVPVLLHSSFLYYTDVLSLACVIWAFSVRIPALSAFCFAFSCLVRQTNIVWAFMYAGMHFFNVVDRNNILRSSFAALLSLIPFIAVGGGFISFVVWNNLSIVLGDASAHVPVFHLSQLLYFFGFWAAHTWPHSVFYVGSFVGGLRRPMWLLCVIVCGCVVWWFTLSHPYLLADNRHVSFYVFRRILSRREVHVSLSPLYAFSIFVAHRASAHLAITTRVLFVFSTFLCLVPAHLFELRYFVVPYALLRLSCPPQSTRLSWMELASNLVLFVVVFFLFLFRPFEWSHEPGTLQRFMW